MEAIKELIEAKKKVRARINVDFLPFNSTLDLSRLRISMTATPTAPKGTNLVTFTGSVTDPVTTSVVTIKLPTAKNRESDFSVSFVNMP